jgi:uncharacterized protein (TIGR02246 family)
MRMIGIAAVLALLATTAQAQDKTTIEKLNETFVTALAKGDIAAVAGMYAEDAYLLPPDEEIVKGRAAIQSFWTKAAEGIGEFKLTTVDVKPLGSDAAREIGTFRLKTKDQPPQEVSGKYVVVWQKVGGEWKLATDIWNATK